MKEANTARLDAAAARRLQSAPAKHLTLQKLERHLWAAADILRGKIDSSDYKHYILGLLFYKRICDVWREEYEERLARDGDPERAAEPEAHRYHIPAGAGWTDVRQKKGRIGRLLNDAFRAIEEANPRLDGVFQDADFDHEERFPDATLEQLLDHFEQVQLGRQGTERDLLGNAYEYLIAQFADDAGKKGGEFYTPKQVVRLLVECLDPGEGMSIYDPTCGSGGMLLEAVHHLRLAGKDPSKLALYGQEMNLSTWAICKINLLIHDIDDAFIARGDTLRHPRHVDAEGRLKTFDRVLANPPFSLRNWGHPAWRKGDRYGRDLYGCPPKSYADLAFVQHMIQSLAPDGRLAVVLPHGILFRGGSEGEIRRGMLRDDLIEAVIGLPERLFYGTSIPACVLFIRRHKPPERQRRILFVDGSQEAMDCTGKNILTPVNVERLVEAFRGFEDSTGFSRVVDVGFIEAQDGDLSLSRYVVRDDSEETIDVEAELEQLRRLQDVRNADEEELVRLLRGLGYGS